MVWETPPKEGQTLWDWAMAKSFGWCSTCRIALLWCFGVPRAEVENYCPWHPKANAWRTLMHSEPIFFGQVWLSFVVPLRYVTGHTKSKWVRAISIWSWWNDIILLAHDPLHIFCICVEPMNHLSMKLKNYPPTGPIDIWLKDSFPFEMVPFQGTFVNFRGGTSLESFTAAKSKKAREAGLAGCRSLWCSEISSFWMHSMVVSIINPKDLPSPTLV